VQQDAAADAGGQFEMITTERNEGAKSQSRRAAWFCIVCTMVRGKY
jgi:hypothetical protein